MFCQGFGGCARFRLLANHRLFFLKAQPIGPVGVVAVPVLVVRLGLGLTIIPWPLVSLLFPDMARSLR
ncbi:hypothetical protein AHiyo8_33730 [Arthrobacter sp. Hiyo8]|nr:hypothetical protein AHiyo8_33730 [Arthrobacter sp. Hiyo8]